MVVTSFDDIMKKIDSYDLGKEKTIQLKRYVKYCIENSINYDLKTLVKLTRESIKRLRREKIFNNKKLDDEKLKGFVYFCSKGHVVNKVAMVNPVKGKIKRDVIGWFCPTCKSLIVKDDHQIQSLVIRGKEFGVNASQ